jgi:hypothetical protein
VRGYLTLEILLSSTNEKCFDLDNFGGAGWVAVPVKRFGGEKYLLSLSKIKPQILSFPGRSVFIPTTLFRYGSRFHIKLFYILSHAVPVPVAARSAAYVCDRSPAESVGSNTTRGPGGLSVVSVVCCQVEVFATS